jgi:alpha-ketoglutarate-dependent taurine dioxygenase
MYVRKFVSGLDVSWQSFFGTTRPEEVEERCNTSSIELEWNNNGDLKMRQVCEAVRRHPISGETILFNQIQLYHPSYLAPSVRESVLALFKTEDDMPRNVYYGDGTVIEQSVIDELSRAYGEAEVVFPWQEGDILLLDNMLTAHARRPYVGPRKIAVAMGELYHALM